MMEKTCLVPQCRRYPCYGFGLSKWVNRKMLWACRMHRTELNAAAKGASGAAVDVASQAVTPKLKPAGPQVLQGSLI